MSGTASEKQTPDLFEELQWGLLARTAVLLDEETDVP